MIEFLEALKGLFKVDIKSLASNFKILSDNTFNFTIIVNKNKQLETINLAKLNKETDRKLGEILRKAPEGTLLINNKTDKLIGDVKTTLTDSKIEEILNFFENKLPPEDFLILTSAMVIRKKLEVRDMESVRTFKHQLIVNYGPKAGIITNLCSAGYFEDFLKPLYEEMSKAQDFEISEFKKVFIKLLNDFPVAIFVSSKMKKQEVEYIVKKKIAYNKQYGVPYLNIHGIGLNNIHIIKSVIKQLKKVKDYSDLKIIEDEPTIIVRLRFD